MADINIERKKKSPLPWIIGLVVLALLAFFLLRGRGDDADENVVVSDTTTAVMPAAPIDTMPMTPPMDTTTMPVAAPMDSAVVSTDTAPVPGDTTP